MTTKTYPYTLSQAQAAIAVSIAKYGPNEAHGSLSYRKQGPTAEPTLAFSFVESPRTPGAYREIGYAS